MNSGIITGNKELLNRKLRDTMKIVAFNKVLKDNFPLHNSPASTIFIWISDNDCIFQLNTIALATCWLLRGLNSIPHNIEFYQKSSSAYICMFTQKQTLTIRQRILETKGYSL